MVYEESMRYAILFSGISFDEWFSCESKFFSRNTCSITNGINEMDHIRIIECDNCFVEENIRKLNELFPNTDCIKKLYTHYESLQNMGKEKIIMFYQKN